MSCTCAWSCFSCLRAASARAADSTASRSAVSAPVRTWRRWSPTHRGAHAVSRSYWPRRISSWPSDLSRRSWPVDRAQRSERGVPVLPGFGRVDWLRPDRARRGQTSANISR